MTNSVSILFFKILAIFYNPLSRKLLGLYPTISLAILSVPSALVSRKFQHYGGPGHLFVGDNIVKTRQFRPGFQPNNADLTASKTCILT